MTIKAGDIVLDTDGTEIGIITCIYGNNDIGINMYGMYMPRRYSEDTFSKLKWSIRSITDNVISPNHYNQGGIEAIDSIRSALTAEEFAGFCKGNILKYVIREKHKNGVEDLKKAQKYMEWLIENKEQTPE